VRSKCRISSTIAAVSVLCTVSADVAAQTKSSDIPIPSLITNAPIVKTDPGLNLEPDTADLQPKMPKYNIRSPNGNECDWEMKMARDLGRGLPTAESSRCRNNAWRKRNRIDDK
jgi:hypothetical protein